MLVASGASLLVRASIGVKLECYGWHFLILIPLLHFYHGSIG
jgi:hypothetical protein